MGIRHTTVCDLDYNIHLSAQASHILKAFNQLSGNSTIHFHIHTCYTCRYVTWSQYWYHVPFSTYAERPAQAKGKF